MKLPEHRSMVKNMLVTKNPGWTIVEKYCMDRIGALTNQLVNEDDEQVRGRIKELEQLLSKVKSCLIKKTYANNPKST